jgi:hypothetical protein
VKQIRKRLTYANVMSSIAVFLVIGGASAFAATQLGKNTVGTKQLKKNAVTAAKIKKNAVTAAKIKADAVTGAKIKAGAVSEAKLADGAVTSGKLALSSVGANQLDANERSEVVASSTSSSFDFVDTYNPATWTTVQSLNLPNGSWVVRSHIGIAIGGSNTHVGCRLIQNGEVLSQTGTEGEVLGFVPSLGGLDLQGIATAGQVTVTCGDSNDGTTAINRSIIATRAGSVTAG